MSLKHTEITLTASHHRKRIFFKGNNSVESAGTYIIMTINFNPEDCDSSVFNPSVQSSSLPILANFLDHMRFQFNQNSLVRLIWVY